ncbi:MAG: DUF2807 domain-containing protein, partial [Sphingobacteriales bacterium]
MLQRTYLLILLLPIFASCDSISDCEDGNTVVTTINRTTEPFHSINLNGSFEVILKPGTDRSILIEADSNLHKHIETAVKRDELMISSENCINPSSPVKIYITSPEIRSLEVNGSGSIISSQLLSTNDEGLLELNIDGSGLIDLEVYTKMIKADIDGSGQIKLHGNTDGQVITLDGSGKYDAFNLKAKETVADLSGSGNID